jgi:hypothetical protein
MSLANTWKCFWSGRREFIICALLFRLLEGFLFLPRAALVGNAMVGRTVLDSTDLVMFLLSPRGFTVLVLAALTNDVMVQCLAYAPLQEVRRLAPELPVGYLMSINARQPGRLEVDLLSAEAGRINGAFVKQAHRRRSAGACLDGG